MGRKNEKQNGAEQKEEENKKKEKGGGNVTVVLKVDLHCEGCAHKVMKSIRSFDDVDAVTIGDDQKITVVGMVDPAKLREKVEKKTHKKVELISPVPKKGGGDIKEKNADGKENAGGGNGKQAEKKKKKEEAKEKPSKDKSEEEKTKEKQMPVITAVFKVNLHCDGCIQRIYKTVTKTKGYEDMKIDKQKDLVAVTGAIDMKALGELLHKQLKKDVEIVPNKKEGEKKGGGGNGDGAAAAAAAAAAANKGGDQTEEKMEANKLQAPMVGYPYPFMYGSAIGDQFNYNPYAVHPYHAPQIFSDENPHACCVM